ncbi:hypothetical protein SASPL_143087 [Salvia splendens]|uniref:Uncharacterized protein n=1 Tax=Salvia splendens TaxID=180675 RepID=A0A8X8Z9Z9_SALSN|nr:uncharacterized protein LOC121770778 [Salvia splendens]KAG6396928.1 hypothetical protein SASPL_143087 [Salvia splendens]
MAVYVEEEEVWKCPKHPSKRRRSGICPTCLRDRLGNLCPICHNARPCPCSSSFSRVSNLIDGEPSFRRSRSLAVPFFRNTAKTPSFFSFLNRSKTKRSEEQRVAINEEVKLESNDRIEDYVRMVSRSRSVNAAATSGMFRRRDESGASPARGKFWHFPSPMKVFRRSKTPKVVVQDRSSPFRRS